MGALAGKAETEIYLYPFFNLGNNYWRRFGNIFNLFQEVQSVWDDDYAANQLLRKKFREQKQDLIAVAMKDKELQKRGALDVNLLPEREEDIELAHEIRYHGKGVKWRRFWLFEFEFERSCFWVYWRSNQARNLCFKKEVVCLFFPRHLLKVFWRLFGTSIFHLCCHWRTNSADIILVIKGIWYSLLVSASSFFLQS